MSDVTWAERLHLFAWPLFAAGIAGVVCPLLGVFLFLRRASFQGVALPQFATAGMVLGYLCLPWWIENLGAGADALPTLHEHPHDLVGYQIAWAALGTAIGLAALVSAARRRGSEPARIAAAFAIAIACTYLIGSDSPFGKEHVEELVRGEILFLGSGEVTVIGVVLGLAAAALLWLRRPLLLASFDPESARVLGLSTTKYEVVLALITGAVVVVGTMTLGPTVLFGLLTLPPLVARRYAKSMGSFLAIASIAGVLSVIGGVVASFELDLPLGPAIVGAAAALLVPGMFVMRRG